MHEPASASAMNPRTPALVPDKQTRQQASHPQFPAQVKAWRPVTRDLRGRCRSRHIQWLSSPRCATTCTWKTRSLRWSLMPQTQSCSPGSGRRPWAGSSSNAAATGSRSELTAGHSRSTSGPCRKAPRQSRTGCTLISSPSAATRRPSLTGCLSWVPGKSTWARELAAGRPVGQRAAGSQRPPSPHRQRDGSH
jgi:hypothetical protein